IKPACRDNGVCGVTAGTPCRARAADSQMRVQIRSEIWFVVADGVVSRDLAERPRKANVKRCLPA
ncbi:hypothetical protein ABTK02_20075, partial [Acinetobacter baumannii]